MSDKPEPPPAPRATIGGWPVVIHGALSVMRSYGLPCCPLGNLPTGAGTPGGFRFTTAPQDRA